jgi:hypothetical protein
MKKIRGKRSRSTAPLRQVFGSRETESAKNIFGDLYNHPELRKWDKKVAELE